MLIAEEGYAGHRLTYVRYIAQYALGCGYDVFYLFGSDVKTSLEAREFDFGSQARYLSGPSLSMAHIWDESDRLGVSRVIIPHADHYLTDRRIYIRRRGMRLNLLVMRTRGIFRPGTTLRDVGKRLLISFANIRPDNHVFRLASSSGSLPWRSPIVTDPVVLEPSRSRDSVRAELDIADDTFVFLIIGAISQRKNVDLVFRALSSLNQSKCALVVAGLQDADARSTIAQIRDLPLTSNLLRVVDRRLDDGELDAFIESADCVVLAHSNEGPSGIFGKALAAGVRILAAGANSLKEDVEKSRSGGIVWSHLDLDAIRRAMAVIVQTPSPTRRSVLGPSDFAARLLR